MLRPAHRRRFTKDNVRMNQSNRKGDFADRFGLSDLGEALKQPASSASRVSESAPAYMKSSSSSPTEGVQRTLGRIVLRQLQRQPNKEGLLVTIVDTLGTPIEELFPAARWLEANKLVRIAERPATGNWKLVLTELGEEDLA
jgi:hypothetical protein